MGNMGQLSLYKLRQTVVLVGMMGSGKSAIGRALAHDLGADLHDSDAEIETSAQLSIAEIFDRYGEAFFRDKETQVIERLLDGPPAVLSTGGGAWMGAANRAVLLQKSVVVWLDVDLDILWKRVRHKDTRPLLQTDDPRATLAQIYAKRHPVYALAPWRVTIEGTWSIQDTTQAVLDVLMRAGGVEKQ